MIRSRFAVACAVFACSALAASAQEIVIRSGLVVGPLARGSRYALHRDPMEQQVVLGKWAAPKAGDSIPGVEGQAGKWRAVEADKDGWFSGTAGGYLYAAVQADAPKVMMLEAAGHGMVYVNGVPRAGDPYEYGYVHLPVALRAGSNDLLFLGGRGRIRARLVPPQASAFLDGADPTLPDLIRGQRASTIGAVTAVNSTEQPVSGLAVEARGPGLRTIRTPIPVLPPLTTRKVAFRIEGAATAEAKDCPVTLRLVGARTSPPLAITLRVREPGQTYKRTFVSSIDGSVQYYAVNPPRRRLPKGERAALVLTLHGASVEAIGQADAYASKPWAYIVAPTNRRPYGFDWEDWGRRDALEVLDLAQRYLNTDPRRAYLTGHSMGGHGTWQVGVLFPDRFAAIGPSAGWISFYSYGGGQRRENPTGVEEILQRSSSASDTLEMARNYASEGVYILHGGADDNVPVTEARHMNTVLAGFHHDFNYFEQPGAGHWWSNTDEPGAACVDWPPMFDMFLRHELPDPITVRDASFSTPNPAVSARCRWATIHEQAKPLAASTISLRVDPNQRRFTGTTSNVALLCLDLGMLDAGKPLSMDLDGQKTADIAWPSDGRLWLRRDGDRWSVASAPGASRKGPRRSGPFKLAFDHHMVFVYGTKGTPDENAQCFAKARYDAETFWYRGNGSVDVLADRDFEPSKFRDRSVILYGNADTNGAWSALLGSSPIQVRRGSVMVGSRKLEGEDLACLFLRPRPDSEVACVGVVAGTGLAGMRLAERMPIFLSGAGFPDCLVAGPDSLTSGAAGVRAAGFFGNDWGIESGDFAWGK
jgi:dienelactone hydrolase